MGRLWTLAAAGGPAALPGDEKKVEQVFNLFAQEILWSADESSALKGCWMATSRRRSMLHRVSAVLITEVQRIIGPRSRLI